MAWLDAAPMACVAIESATGRVVHVNAEARRLASIDIGDPWWADLGGEALAHWRSGQANPQGMIGSKRWALRMTMAPTGAHVLVWIAPATLDATATASMPECLADPVLPADGSIAHDLGAQSDLRRHREAQARIDRLIEQLDVAKEFGRLGVWSRDVVSDQGIWDDQVHRFFGFDPTQPAPGFAEAASRIHPDDRERAVLAWRTSVHSGDFGEARFRVLSPAGTTRMLHSVWRMQRDTLGHARRAVGVMIDDSGSYALAQGIGELSSRFELAADLAGIGIWRFDVASGLIHWDERVFHMFGMPAHDHGTPVEQVRAMAHPDDVPDIVAATDAALHGNAPVDTLTRFRRIDGREIVLMTRRVAQRDADGRVVGLFGVTLDVTERRSAEVRWRFALEGSGDGVWDWNVVDASVFYSDRYCGLLGYAHGEIGDDFSAWASRVHPDDLLAAQAALNAHLAGASDSYVSEHRLRCKDGVWRWFFHRGKAVERDANGRALRVIGTLVDLSERKLDEARWRYALEGAGDALWEWVAESDKVFYSDRLQTMLGHAPGDFSDELSEWEDRVHPDDFPRVDAEADRHIAGEIDAYAVEYRIRCKDGSWKWVLDRGQAVERDAQGRAMRMVGTLVDLTERKRAESALRAAQERIALAANAVGIGIWERDVALGESFWDAQMYRLFGVAVNDERSPEALRRAAIHHDDLAAFDALVAQAAQSGEPFAAEFRVVPLDQRGVRWLATRGVVSREADGRTPRVVGVTWDVTEARQAEAALRDKEAAERANRAKSEFLSRMSHELRTPLNAILGFTQLMQVDAATPLSAGQRERLDRIHSASWHLLALINDVLDLARIEAGGIDLVREPVRLGEVMNETVHMVEPQAQASGIVIDCAIGADATVWGDRTRLRQVFLNVLSNAVKYNRPGGRVTVRAERTGAREAVVVSDTGCGMAPDRMAHLFEPFNRLGAERSGIEGTGIGLAISRKLVEQMGGEILAASVQGEGSTFRVMLQSVSHGVALSAPPGERVARATMPRAVRARVVYIEDNPVNTLLVSELLAQRPGVVLDAAPDGLSGVALVERTLPDLVLIDMQLPDIDGDEVFRRLRTNPSTRGIPCVALSANAMEMDIDAARQMGFQDYWTKPIDVAAFLSRIDALFGR